MSGYNQTIPIVAGAALGTFQWRALAIAGTLATGVNARGIVQNAPDNGEAASIAFAGRSKFVAGGGTIAVGAKLACSSGGFMITATSGASVVGFCENTAVTSGSIGHGVFDFIAGNGGNV